MQEIFRQKIRSYRRYGNCLATFSFSGGCFTPGKAFCGRGVLILKKTRGDAYGHTPDTDRRRSRVLSTAAQDTHNMGVDYAFSAKAPPLQINLDADMMHGLARTVRDTVVDP